MKALQPGADIKLQDKFFVGGPLTLRGFNLKGVGPSEDGVFTLKAIILILLYKAISNLFTLFNN